MDDHFSFHRAIEEEKSTANPTVYWKLRRSRVLDCSYCRPNIGENADRRMPRSDRYKDTRKRKYNGKPGKSIEQQSSSYSSRSI